MISIEEFSKLQENLFALKNENYDLKTQKQRLIKENEQLKSGVNSKQSTTVKPNTIKPQASIETSLKNDEKILIEEFRKNENELKNKISLLSSESKTFENQILTLKEELSQLTQKSANANETIDQLNKEKISLKESYDVEIKNFNSQNEEIKNQLNLLRNSDEKEILVLKKQIQTNEKSYSARLDDFEEEMVSYKQMIETLNTEKQKDIGKLKSQCNELLEKLEEYEKQNKELENQIKKKNDEINKFNIQVEVFDKKSLEIQSKYEFMERLLKKNITEDETKIIELNKNLLEIKTKYEKEVNMAKAKEEEYNENRMFFITEINHMITKYYDTIESNRITYFIQKNEISLLKSQLKDISEKYKIIENTTGKKVKDLKKLIRDIKNGQINSSKIDSISMTSELTQGGVEPNLLIESSYVNRNVYSTQESTNESNELDNLINRLASLQEEKWSIEERAKGLEAKINVLALDLQSKNYIMNKCFSFIDPSISVSNFNHSLINKYIKTDSQYSEKILTELLTCIDEVVHENSKLKAGHVSH